MVALSVPSRLIRETWKGPRWYHMYSIGHLLCASLSPKLWDYDELNKMVPASQDLIIDKIPTLFCLDIIWTLNRSLPSPFRIQIPTFTVKFKCNIWLDKRYFLIFSAVTLGTERWQSLRIAQKEIEYMSSALFPLSSHDIEVKRQSAAQLNPLCHHHPAPQLDHGVGINRCFLAHWAASNSAWSDSHVRNPIAAASIQYTNLKFPYVNVLPLLVDCGHI